MKQHIDHLQAISQKGERRIIGLMSGTSLDGLDVALCRVTGSGTQTQLSVEHFTTVPYDEAFRNEVRKVFAQQTIDFQQLCVMNPYIGTLHGGMILQCLEKWKVAPAQVDLIASHGQTVFHAPRKQHMLSGFPNATLQIGDADHIAVHTGIITISDFRQKHIAAGGEGAPLAVYGDFFLFSNPKENRILLNMGGIANFTYLPASLNASEVFTTDTGPGNTLIDAFTRRFYHQPFDENGHIAASGQVHGELLDTLKRHSFFSQPFPKTTGPEVFSTTFVEQVMEGCAAKLQPDDLIATLTRFTAETIAGAIHHALDDALPYVMYASGGGAHNQTLMRAISELLPGLPVKQLDELGVSGDAKEAVLFAVLANETMAGTHTFFGAKDGVPGVSLGKISFPG
ncbi:anhydro-N-acetylmuramic acid kinase [Dyadobacter sandarakinus]|uniref:Anhydro-N-acetylmuramic acid kinase n=1 Tax=Dyadobacter sandarakinus TaxID=2747268 RepID=A0ABX7IB44_9BACT|nr:anhydro-N-acetylmuramic acid kinase [Dyadobacter sandarakinus]QRR03025.1 anhydro-N-acetylmuramic acid kinase [Dyadobacter sandarakinus]